jgi:hypothetical protein
MLNDETGKYKFKKKAKKEANSSKFLKPDLISQTRNS